MNASSAGAGLGAEGAQGHAYSERTVLMDAGHPPQVHLTIPATSRYLRLARLTAAGLAGDLGYSVDAIEDLRIAVDELCAAIIESTPANTSLDLTYREIDGGLEVTGRCPTESGDVPELHGVARELLNMLADEYAIGAVDGHRDFRLVKYAESGSS